MRLRNDDTLRGPTVVEYHSLLVERIYHEDGLFAQRTSQFIAGSAFLVAAAVLGADRHSLLALLTASLGLFLSVTYVPTGLRHLSTLAYWNKILDKFEIYHQIPFNHTESEDHERKRFPWVIWKINLLKSPSFVLGVLTPMVISLFWVMFIIIFSGGIVLPAASGGAS